MHGGTGKCDWFSFSCSCYGDIQCMVENMTGFPFHVLVSTRLCQLLMHGGTGKCDWFSFSCSCYGDIQLGCVNS